MNTVDATHLKNHLGSVLQQASLGPVAIERHGRVVAYLIPARATGTRSTRRRPPTAVHGWTRRDEDRATALCAGGDFRPSRWLRAGDPRLLAGIATMLASEHGFDRTRMLALAERLDPGMSTAANFARWLATSPVHAARFLPSLRARMRESQPGAPNPVRRK